MLRRDHHRLIGSGRRGWEIALVDINPVILEATDNGPPLEAADRPARITAAVDRRDVLDGATIICTIGVGSRRAWEQDASSPPVRSTSRGRLAPRAACRAMRMISPMVAIDRLRPMCPNARFINYGNPMTAVVRALWRKTNVRPSALPRDRGHHALLAFRGRAGAGITASGRGSTTSPGSSSAGRRGATSGP
jgi:hypothetical protein